MAFGTRPAGQTTRPNPSLEYLALSNISIAKGVVAEVNDAGFIVVSTNATSAGRAKFVTIEAVDNSGGAAGDIPVGTVGTGQYVTVTAASDTATLSPGDGVKVSDTDPGEVELFVAGTDAAGLKVGTYLRREGGTIAKNPSTPFTEEFTDDGDFSPGNAVAGDIIEIRIEV